ncbi:hypothetical protein [Desulfovibrio ferrophilus]|uniref:PAS domain-containing protein n=1 Tax=Desulfovibrio ferrophilus TaxID=241368 RepID=A0A2Z6AWU7_9BACT|nr:hypothetical protein [Desulfovibrio ferrophilus]BBD07727.1 uncharacterized protein DFE_1001 [Desulfovibrio ferrophilus]
MRDSKTITQSRGRNIPIEDLQSFVGDFPALLWRIEIAKSRIEFLNDYPLAPLGEDARLFLKNKNFRKQLLLPEDAHLLDAFMDAVKEGRTMATVFRVHAPSGGVMWLKLTGAVNTSDPRYYYGYCLDISDTVEVIQGIQQSDNKARLRIDNVPTPVMLVDFKTRRLKQANAAARDQFGLPRSMGGKRPEFASLYPSSVTKAVDRILDDLPFEHSWSGRLEFKNVQGDTFMADSTLRYVGWKQRALVRISIIPVEQKQQHRAEPSAISQCGPGDMDCLSKELLKDAPDLSTMLDRLMDHPLIQENCDAIMLSDIHIRKNKVIVYGAGEVLEGMTTGEEFSYKGTVAEDIVRFGLDHLVVDDTMDSIKPIDWALFIPRGIRSYFAKPFYERKVLRTVVILCSTEPNRFTGLGSEAFESILGTLNSATRTWRRNTRTRSSSS